MNFTGIKCNVTSAYYPQSNGLDERFNQTLQRQLLKFVSDEPRNWDLFLDSILFFFYFILFNFLLLIIPEYIASK